MTSEEKILEMLTAINGRLDSMDGRLDSMDGRLDSMDSRLGSLESEMEEVKAELKQVHEKVDDLTEAHEETRASVNALLDWAERASNSYDLPLPKLV